VAQRVAAAVERLVIAYLLALLIGILAGLRTMTAPAAVSWAAHLGWLRLDDTWLAFLSYAWTPWILTLLAAGELVTDQLPSTPSRTVPVQFGARIAMGALSGTAFGAAGRSLLFGGVAGIIGAVIGTPRRPHRPGAACRGLRQGPTGGPYRGRGRNSRRAADRDGDLIKPDDCCVFCSFGSVPCPPIQLDLTDGSMIGHLMLSISSLPCRILPHIGGLTPSFSA